MNKMKPLGTEHLEGTDYKPANETSLMFGAASEEEIQEAITKNAQLAETGFSVREDNPLGLASNEESIAHIAAQEKILDNSIAAPGPFDDYTGPMADIKIPKEFLSGKSQDDPFSKTFSPKDEAQIWKERYYLLLAVVNTFHKN